MHLKRSYILRLLVPLMQRTSYLETSERELTTRLLRKARRKPQRLCPSLLFLPHITHSRFDSLFARWIKCNKLCCLSVQQKYRLFLNSYRKRQYENSNQKDRCQFSVSWQTRYVIQWTRMLKHSHENYQKCHDEEFSACEEQKSHWSKCQN